MDRRMLIAGAGVALAAPALAFSEEAGPAALARRFVETLTAHDMVAFSALFAEDYVNHQVSAAAPPVPAGTSDKQASMAFFAARLKGIPDLVVSIEALVASGDQVAASFVNTGTQTGPVYGVAPTGRALRFSSCDIFRVRDGLFVEHWGMGDIAGVLAQIRS